MKSIIFTHLKPDIFQYKAGFVLKEKDIKTISISLLKVDREFFKDAFDEIISLDLDNMKPITLLKSFVKHPIKLLKFFYNVATIRADYSICQSAPNYLSALFMRLFKNKFPRIYFPYDINSAGYKDIESFLRKREIWGERYCFDNCDGFMFKSGEGELNFVPKEFNLFDKRRINFSAYVLKKWCIKPAQKEKLSNLNKELHIVWAGGYPKDKGNNIVPSFSKIFKPIITQKIHLHFYLVKGTLIPEKHINEMAPTNELKSFIHIHEFVSPEKLPKELSKYDFGLNIQESSEFAKEGSVRFQSANKVASYLEAGIPFITNEELEIYSSMINKEGVGVVIKNDFFGIKKEVKNSNYQEMVKNVIKFREKYSFENNIQRLIDFLDSIPLN